MGSMKSDEKKYWIKYTRRLPLTGSVTQTEYFEFKENRDMVYEALKNNRTFELHGFGQKA